MKMKMANFIRELKANGYRYHDTYEIDEAACGGWIVTVYDRDDAYSFDEYLYDKKGNLVEGTRIGLYNKTKIY